MRAEGRTIGSLSISDRAGRLFTEAEARLLQAFADQAALALENARLYAETTRRRHEAEELARLAQTLTESLDVSDVVARTVESVLPLFGARSSVLRLLPARRLAGGAGARGVRAAQLRPRPRDCRPGPASWAAPSPRDARCGRPTSSPIRMRDPGRGPAGGAARSGEAGAWPCPCA